MQTKRPAVRAQHRMMVGWVLVSLKVIRIAIAIDGIEIKLLIKCNLPTNPRSNASTDFHTVKICPFCDCRPILFSTIPTTLMTSTTRTSRISNRVAFMWFSWHQEIRLFPQIFGDTQIVFVFLFDVLTRNIIHIICDSGNLRAVGTIHANVLVIYQWDVSKSCGRSIAVYRPPINKSTCLFCKNPSRPDHSPVVLRLPRSLPTIGITFKLALIIRATSFINSASMPGSLRNAQEMMNGGHGAAATLNVQLL